MVARWRGLLLGLAVGLFLPSAGLGAASQGQPRFGADLGRRWTLRIAFNDGQDTIDGKEEDVFPEETSHGVETPDERRDVWRKRIHGHFAGWGEDATRTHDPQSIDITLAQYSYYIRADRGPFYGETMPIIVDSTICASCIGAQTNGETVPFEFDLPLDTMFVSDGEMDTAIADTYVHVVRLVIANSIGETVTTETEIRVRPTYGGALDSSAPFVPDEVVLSLYPRVLNQMNVYRDEPVCQGDPEVGYYVSGGVQQSGTFTGEGKIHVSPLTVGRLTKAAFVWALDAAREHYFCFAPLGETPPCRIKILECGMFGCWISPGCVSRGSALYIPDAAVLQQHLSYSEEADESFDITLSESWNGIGPTSSGDYGMKCLFYRVGVVVTEGVMNDGLTPFRHADTMVVYFNGTSNDVTPNEVKFEEPNSVLGYPPFAMKVCPPFGGCYFQRFAVVDERIHQAATMKLVW